MSQRIKSRLLCSRVFGGHSWRHFRASGWYRCATCDRWLDWTGDPATWERM